MTAHNDDERHEGGCLACQLRDAKERIAMLTELLHKIAFGQVVVHAVEQIQGGFTMIVGPEDAFKVRVTDERIDLEELYGTWDSSAWTLFHEVGPFKTGGQS